MPVRQGTTKGFKRSAALLAPQIRKASESRGFAVSRVLTHWAEIVGDEIAAIARPVEVTYGRQAFGATLSVLTTGAHAPMLEMQKETLRERVNAAYGYNAIARIRLTQTASTGFAEGQAQFVASAKEASNVEPDPVAKEKASIMAAEVDNTDLRDALETLAQNVLSKRNN